MRSFTSRISKLIFPVLFLSLFSCDQKATQDDQVQRPNIVFIMADDHAEQAISAFGHPISQLAPTPNIDRIAENGAIFHNNFNTNSICGPSRAVILTGKHSHINGFRMNGETFDGSQPTLPKYMQEAGYKTAVIGKWHLHGKPQGFDYWKILKDQGNYYNPVFIEEKDTGVIQGYATDIITALGLDWLKETAKQEKPFFLMLQHKAPHRNWMPALRHINKYDSIRFPLPVTYFSEHEDQIAAQQQQQTIYEDMYEGHDLRMTIRKGSDSLRHNPWTTDFERMTPEQREVWNASYRPKNDAFHEADLEGKALAKWKFQRYVHDYMATVAAIDEGVGKILDFLEASGLDENTIVVYTTDQGFFLGEKGFFDKRFMYEPAMAMPLLIKYPGVIEPGTEIDALTQNLDFAPTFLDFAGIEIPEDMQGQSFKDLLTGEASGEVFRGAVYYHYYDFPAFHMVKKQYGVRTDRYKLIHFYDDIDQWEMYDLKTDPLEEDNIYGEPKYADIQAQLHKTLDSLQRVYKVTEKEFERAPKEKVLQAYRNFEKLAGKD
ncbi:MAG TPA: sulfatase [Salinimicrobium sp.]|nr:sulfatase [Salinimicrobium sp.]